MLFKIGPQVFCILLKALYLVLQHGLLILGRLLLLFLFTAQFILAENVPQVQPFCGLVRVLISIKILMSGDNRFEEYNEPAAMKAYAVSLGVPEEAIVLDYAGRRTYDTCFRAGEIFGLEEALLVTQKFHLPRALFTCSGMGMKANGVIADLRDYHTHSLRYWNIREIPATLVAVWQVWVSRPLPVLGEPEPIFTANNTEN